MHAIAAAWGGAIGRYARRVITPRSIEMIRDAPLPTEPVIWFGWHEANLITIAMHRIVMARPVVAFVPAGARGSVVRGWLHQLDVSTVPLGGGVAAGVAFRAMRHALNSGADVLIAADGPDGPRHLAKSGALLLASKTRARIMPVGCAAVSALRAPRWDRHLIPLPGARVVIVIGAPLTTGDHRSGAAALCAAATLNALTARAESALATRRNPTPFDKTGVEISSWK